MATVRDMNAHPKTSATRLTPTTRNRKNAEPSSARGRAGASPHTLAGGVRTENSAFMSSPLPVAGFAVIDAADLAEAIQIVSKTPCAVAHGVWPLEQTG
jgi:hypothetical protein